MTEYCQDSMFIMQSSLYGATDGLLSGVIRMLLSSIEIETIEEGKECDDQGSDGSWTMDTGFSKRHVIRK